MSESGTDTKYKPYNDLRLYPGIHLSEERKKQLDEDAIEPDQLSAEDIIYKLGRMVTGTMYTLLAMVEDKWGKEAARETAVEWGRQRARENLAGWMKSRGRHQPHPRALGPLPGLPAYHLGPAPRALVHRLQWRERPCTEP